jgi:hypothetical protein
VTVYIEAEWGADVDIEFETTVGSE